MDVQISEEDRDSVRADIAIFSEMLEDSEKLRAFIARNGDIVADEDHARDTLRGIIAGLDDLLHGRLIPHEEVVREMEERLSRAHPDAAE
jgi:predicted transcriptional regulator